MKTTVTTANIAAQIAAIDETLAELEAEASRQSYAAVSGDQAAVQALTDINAKSALVTADRVVLARAMITAAEIEEKARVDDLEAIRLGHLADATAAAEKLLTIAERADALTRDCTTTLAELSQVEDEVRTSFFLAGEPLNIGRVGRNGISGVLLGNLNNSDAIGDFVTKKGVADIVRVGWAELLEADGGDE